MNFFEPSVRIIHFEYDQNLRGELSGNQDFKAELGPKRSNVTNKITGFYFKWVIRLFSGNGIFLSAIGMDGYSTNDPSKIKAKEMKLLMEKSIADFKLKVFNELGEPLVFDIPIDESLAALFILELCND